MRAIQITEFGGPEVLQLAELPDPVPGAGEVLIDVSRAGVNYADTHQTENSYVSETKLPLVPGNEVVGKVGDRRVAAFLPAGSGAYAEKAVTSQASVLDMPEEVDDVTALGLMVQGTTAAVLLRRTTHLEPGESVVVHAAAGGVGSLAVQLAKSMGAGRVIATASTPEKRQLALDLGADAAVDPATEDLTAALREANEGKRVDIVLEMTGGRVTDQSLAALAPLGRLAYYGAASRETPSPVELSDLLTRSITVSGMWLAHSFAKPGLLSSTMEYLVGEVLAGRLKVIAGGDYPLAEAKQAHEDLRGRRTRGKLTINAKA